MGYGNNEQKRAWYLSRAAQHRCVKCGTKLAPAYRFKTCTDCLQYVRQYSKVWRAEKRLEAAEPHEAPKVQPGTRCPVCRLLEPHTCIQGSAQARRGPGMVYPEGGP